MLFHFLIDKKLRLRYDKSTFLKEFGFLLANSYDISSLFSEIKNSQFDILDYIKAVPPFSYFDIDGEYKALNNFFYGNALEHYEEDFKKYGTYFYEQ